MPVSPHYRVVDIEPLTGLLDTRSPAQELTLGTWRMRQNCEITSEGKLIRSPGWRKLLGGKVSQYNNQDLHDQLCGDPVGCSNLQQYYDELTPPHTPASDVSTYPPSAAYCGTVLKTRAIGRQPVTFLMEVTSTVGIRKLLAGTQNRLYVLNETKGNWKLIADKYGGSPKDGLPERRWVAAANGDTVTFTNNFDPVLIWNIGQPVSGCDMQSVSTIPDLETLRLTKASIVIQWKGVNFLMDVEMDGARWESRIVWGALGLPFSWVPGAGSIASYQDLPYGERILAAAPLGDYLMIYTTNGIWQVSFIGGDAVFNFRSVYSDPSRGYGCIAFPGTLVSTGDAHLYAARDGIYLFNPYMAKPQLEEWIHRASNTMFDNLNRGLCKAHVGHYDAERTTYYLSYVEAGASFPAKTLAFNLRYRGAYTLDHGFTAFCNFTSDNRPSIKDWLLSKCICTSAELASQTSFQTETKEGGTCFSVADQDCSGVSRSTPLWTRAVREVDGKFVEDWSRPKPDADSLCAVLGGVTIEDLCQECNANRLLIAASAVDWCLKEMDRTVYFRERCVTFTGCGSYIRDGYESIQLSGPCDYGKASEIKNVRRVELDAEPEDQTTPSNVFLRIGYSGQPIDPLKASGACAIVWRPQPPKQLKCLSEFDAETHEKSGTRPNKTIRWNTFYSSRYLYFEVKIVGTGGACQLSRIGTDVRLMPSTITA